MPNHPKFCNHHIFKLCSFLLSLLHIVINDEIQNFTFISQSIQKLWPFNFWTFPTKYDEKGVVIPHIFLLFRL